MNLNERFDSMIYPKVRDIGPKIKFITNRYSIQLERITYTVPQPFVVGTHEHSTFEFHYCPSGGGTVTIENRKFHIKPGVFFITGPYVSHSQISTKDNPTEELGFMANIEPIKLNKPSENNIIYSDFDEILDIIVKNKNFFGADIYNAGASLKKIFELMPLDDSTMNISQYWIFILQTLVSTAQNIQKIPSTLTCNLLGENLDSNRLAILDDIFRGYHVNMSPEIAADRLGVSVRQLNRITVKHFGMTFKQKYLETRMELALTLLENLDNLSIDEISQKLNFGSLQYFSRIFKEFYGMSPTQYRRSNVK